MNKVIEKIKSQGKEQVEKTIRIAAIITTAIIVVIWLVLTQVFKEKKENVSDQILFEQISESVGNLENNVGETFEKTEDSILNDDNTSIFEVTDDSEFLPLEETVTPNDALENDYLGSPNTGEATVEDNNNTI